MGGAILRKTWVRIGIAALIAVFFCLIARPGTQGPLFLDSVKLLPLEQDVDKRGIGALLNPTSFSTSNGMDDARFGRPVSIASFVANILISDELIPAHLKWTNAAIHLLVGIIIFLVSRRLWALYTSPTRAEYLALLVTTLWLFSPVNLTVVFYSVQRMAQLAALFVMLGLYCYISARESHSRSQQYLWLTACLAVCLPLAYLSKENGLILIPLVLTLEAVVWRFGGWAYKPGVWISAIVVAGTAAALGIFWLFPEFFDYSNRSFGIQERLLTQGRVLFSYLGKLLFPWQPDAGIYHDGFQLSRGLFSPTTTFVSLAAILALLFAAVLMSIRRPLLGLGILFFFVGHLIESTALPLEIYFLHRNYLPSVGIFLALASVVDWLSLKIAARWLALGVALYCGLFLLVGYGKSNTWSTRESVVVQGVQYHPDSSRASSDLAQILLERGRLNDSLAILDNSIRNHAPETRLRTRLQKLFVLCVANVPINDEIYQHLLEAQAKGVGIEVSQALLNILRLYEQGRCEKLDVPRFVSVLDEIADKFRKNEKDPWQVSYYANALLLGTGQRTQVYERLEQQFKDGERRAGQYLLHLYRQEGHKEKARALERALGEGPSGT